MTQRNPATRNFEIRSTDDWNMLRLVGGGDAFADRLKQCLKRGTVRMFGGVAACEILFDFVKIRPEGCHARRVEKHCRLVNSRKFKPDGWPTKSCRRRQP